MAKAIVSYDGTDNDRDALALGKLLAGAGASLTLVYVRHASDDGDTTHADELLATGAAALGGDVPTHVVVSGSTPEGLRSLAVENGADLIVFGSEYRTARGHVDPQRSARRLLEGGPIALGIAPAGFASNGHPLGAIGAVVEDGDPCVLETAQALASRLGAEVAREATSDLDLMVVGSKPGTVNGRVTISAAAEYLIELAQCPVIVLPRGVGIEF